ncbi:MAG: hypothetical protein ABH873_10350 [Candidatus Firestonebacteria bacterium]
MQREIVTKDPPTQERYGEINQIKNDRVGKFFYLTLIITILHGGFILWDLFCLIIGKANTVYSAAAFSNIYLIALSGYAGYKEFVRWMESPYDSNEEVAKEKILRFKRGEIITTLWILLYLACLTIERFHLISRLPFELERTALQVFAIVVGTYGSKSLFIGRARKILKSGSHINQSTGNALDGTIILSDEECEAKVIEFIEKNGGINNEQCRQILMIERGKSYRILENMEKKGKIFAEGMGRAITYRKR